MLHAQVARSLQLENTKKCHNFELCEIAHELKISEDSVFIILHDYARIKNMVTLVDSSWLEFSKATKISKVGWQNYE